MADPEPLPEPIPLRSLTWPGWADRWLLPYLRRSELWPVLLAVLGHVGLAIALLLLVALVDRNPAGWAALWLVGSGTFALVRHEWRGEGRPGVVSAAVGIAWALGGIMTWAAIHYEIW